MALKYFLKVYLYSNKYNFTITDNKTNEFYDINNLSEEIMNKTVVYFKIKNNNIRVKIK